MSETITQDNQQEKDGGDAAATNGQLARSVGLRCRAVRFDLLVLAVVVGIAALVSFLFFDKRVSLFVDGLPGNVREVMGHLTHLGDSLYYFVAIILGLFLNRVLDFRPIKKHWHIYAAYIVGLAIVFWIAKLWEGFGAVTLLGVALTCYLVRSRRKDFASWAFFLIGALAWTGIGVNLIKMPFGRFRPIMLLENGEFGFSWFSATYNQLSFPSGHSATIAAVMTTCWLMKQKWWPVWIAGGLFVALTRVFTNSHYISDVLAGLYVGTLLTLLLHYLVTQPGKIGEKLVPIDKQA